MAGLGSIRLAYSRSDGEPPDDAVAQPFLPRDIDLSGDSSPIEPSKATKIETADGGVVVYIGPPRNPRRRSDRFDENLAEDLPETTLGHIGEELLVLRESDVLAKVQS